MTAPANRHLPLALGTVLVLAVVGAFAGVGGNAFLGYDDPLYVGAPQIQDGLSLGGLGWALSSGAASNWHPVTWASHMLDVELFGNDPGGHHLMGLGLHALNALLFYLFLWRATGRALPAFLAAGLFGLHPLRVESVAWAAERKDLLAGTFFMVVLLAHVSRARGAGVGAAWVRALALALGLAAKPTLVPVPLVLLALDRWPLDRVRDLGWRRLIVEKLPLFGLAAASSAVTLFVQRAGGALETVDALPLHARLANGTGSIAAYLGDTLWPRPTAVFQPHPWFVAEDLTRALWLPGILGALAAVGVSFVVWRLRERRPELLAGWAVYLAFLAPVLGWVQVGSQARADRYTYLAGTGLALGLAFALEGATRGRPRVRALFVGSWVCALGLLGGMTRREVEVWRNDRSLFVAALERSPRNPVAHLQLGLADMEASEPAAAAEHFREAYRLDPGTVEAPVGLAVALLALGRTDEALELLEELTTTHPGVFEPWLDLGLGRLAQGDAAGAEAALARAHELDPDDVRAIEPLAGLRLARGEYGRAEPLFALLVERSPERADYRNDRAVLYERTGREDLALGGYEEARRLAGNTELGARAARGAAWILSTSPRAELRDGERARARAREALGFLEEEAGTWNVLAAAEARAGDFVRAREAQEQALRRTADPGARATLEGLLELYRRGQPFTRP